MSFKVDGFVLKIANLLLNIWKKLLFIDNPFRFNFKFAYFGKGRVACCDLRQLFLV